MNTRKGKMKFKNFRIIFDSGCGPTVVIGRLIKNLTPKQYAMGTVRFIADYHRNGLHRQILYLES